MMKRVMVAKNIEMRRHVITFFSRVASGRESPTTPIMKAMAVPRGMPFATNTSTTGTMPAALAYIGTARITLSGTAYQLSRDIYCSKNPSGMKPCMNAPMPMPIRTYTNTLLTICHASLMMVGSRCVKVALSLSHCSVCSSDCACTCFTQSLR